MKISEIQVGRAMLISQCEFQVYITHQKSKFSFRMSEEDIHHVMRKRGVSNLKS